MIPGTEQMNGLVLGSFLITFLCVPVFFFSVICNILCKAVTVFKNMDSQNGSNFKQYEIV
jgi:hypothetical protein